MIILIVITRQRIISLDLASAVQRTTQGGDKKQWIVVDAEVSKYVRRKFIERITQRL